MFFPDILLDGLDTEILYRRGCTEKRPRRGILLLDGEPLPEAGPLYLGHWQDIPTELPKDTCIFCAEGNSYAGDYDRLCPQCTDLVVFRLSLTKLYNEVSTRYRRYNDWCKELDSTQDLQKMTEMAASASGWPVAVVDSFFKKKAFSSVEPPKSELFRRLAEEGALPQDAAETMLSTERGNQYADRHLFGFQEQVVTDHLIRYDGRSIARVLVEQSVDANHHLTQCYIEDFLSAVRPLIQASDVLQKLSMNAISTLIADLIDLRVGSVEELERRRKLVPDMVKGKYYHPIVIRFQNPGADIPYNYITGQLEHIFRFCSVTSYNQGLLVIAAKELYDADIEYDRNQLMALLERFDGYAGVGDCTMFLSSLRPLYIQASAAARLGRTFSDDKKQRIFHYVDYRMYFYADLVIEAAVRQHDFRNISYLCSPGVISVLRYDQKHEKDLYRTLQVYLECNCNATLCAQKMSIHRNTVNYRIDLIEKLMGNTLSDFKFRQTVDFSMMIVEYEIKYLHCNPLDTSGQLAMDLDWGSFRSFTDRP